MTGGVSRASLPCMKIRLLKNWNGDSDIHDLNARIESHPRFICDGVAHMDSKVRETIEHAIAEPRLSSLIRDSKSPMPTNQNEH